MSNFFVRLFSSSSVVPAFPLLLLLLLLFLSSFSFSFSMKTAQVDDICSKHRNPSFCEAVLNSMTGGAAQVDLASVGQSIILSTHTNAYDTLALIHSLINKTSDVQLKQHYETCSENFDDAIFEINEAKKSLISGDYNGVFTAASAVEKDAEACDSNPPPDPSQLPKNNKNLQDLTIIVMIVSVFLAHD